MTEMNEPKKLGKRAKAAKFALAAKRRKLNEAHAKEDAIKDAVVDIIAGRLAIEEAETAISGGIRALKRLGETHASIAERCDMTPTEVRGVVAKLEVQTKTMALVSAAAKASPNGASGGK